MYLPTYHLSDGYDRTDCLSTLAFSPDEKLMAQTLPDHNLINIWDIGTRKIVRALRYPLLLGAIFSPRTQLIAAYGLQGGYILDVLNGKIQCEMQWGKFGLENPFFTLFDSLGATFMVISGSKILHFDAVSGNLVNSDLNPRNQEFAVNWLVDCQANVISQVPKSGQEDISLGDLAYFNAWNPKSCRVFDLDQGNFVHAVDTDRAIIESSQHSIFEIWDIQNNKIVCTLPATPHAHSFQFGPNSDWLAFSHDTRQRKNGCVLQIWDLQIGKCIHDVEDAISWNILWSKQSNLLAVSNLFAYEQGLKRNLTIFMNPIEGRILSYTYGHSASGHSSYVFSPSGKLFASQFGTEYISNAGDKIIPGTVAITNLLSIL